MLNIIRYFDSCNEIRNQMKQNQKKISISTKYSQISRLCSDNVITVNEQKNAVDFFDCTPFE